MHLEERKTDAYFQICPTRSARRQTNSHNGWHYSLSNPHSKTNLPRTCVLTSDYFSRFRSIIVTNGKSRNTTHSKIEKRRSQTNPPNKFVSYPPSSIRRVWNTKINEASRRGRATNSRFFFFFGKSLPPTSITNYFAKIRIRASNGEKKNFLAWDEGKLRFDVETKIDFSHFKNNVPIFRLIFLSVENKKVAVERRGAGKCGLYIHTRWGKKNEGVVKEMEDGGEKGKKKKDGGKNTVRGNWNLVTPIHFIIPERVQK